MSKKYISLLAISVFALMTGFNEAKSMDTSDSSSDEGPRRVRVSKEIRDKTSITLHNESDYNAAIYIGIQPAISRDTAPLVAGSFVYVDPKSTRKLQEGQLDDSYPDHTVTEVFWRDPGISGKWRNSPSCQFLFDWGQSYEFILAKEPTSPSGHTCEERGG